MCCAMPKIVRPANQQGSGVDSGAVNPFNHSFSFPDTHTRVCVHTVLLTRNRKPRLRGRWVPVFQWTLHF